MEDKDYEHFNHLVTGSFARALPISARLELRIRKIWSSQLRLKVSDMQAIAAGGYSDRMQKWINSQAKLVKEVEQDA